MSAIILDGHLKSALAAVRSLGWAGVRVSAGAERATAMSLHSRYAADVFLYASPYENQERFIDRVKREAKRLGDRPVVYAFSDATYLSLFEHRDELAACATLVVPEETAVGIAFDKAATYSLARVSGIPTIPTYTPATKEELTSLAGRLAYPAVVKARRSVSWKDGKGIFGSVTFVRSREDFIDRFFELRNRYGEAPLVQELVYGDEYGVEMLARAGKPYARVTHRRVRSLAPTGGASVVKETLGQGSLRNTLEAYAEMLVSKLSWSGPIMVEFKVDSDSQRPYLMEVNGRFWGSLPLSVAAGVDVPRLFYDVARGEEPAGLATARDGVVTRHFLGDVLHLARVLFALDPMRRFLYPGRFETLAGFFTAFFGTESDVWSFRDPKPAFMEIADTIRKQLWK